jgi:hypothetical protein
MLSLITIAALCVWGLWVFVTRGHHRQLDGEGRRVLFLVAAFAVPWGAAIAISHVRPLYCEKYYLYLMPPLLILFAWTLTRARHVIVSRLILLGLIGLIGTSLTVYYTEPVGEQWREAVAYMRPSYQAGDVVLIVPGHYVRPYYYYFYDELREDLDTFARAPVVVVEDKELRIASLPEETDDPGIADPGLASAKRVWFLSGYAPVDPEMAAWIEENFEALDIHELVGARVQLLQRSQDPGARAITIRE